MEKTENTNNEELAEHLFRIEYGKIVAVIIKFLGVDNLKIAEDIAQETFYKAVKSWQHNGTPPNPKAWLYTTAKNECLNTLKKAKRQRNYKNEIRDSEFNHLGLENLVFTDQVISDEQLKMMFVCCHSSISHDAQLSLMLKILCGFSISEIASAFFTSKETINKRLVRARKKLKENKVSFTLPADIEREIPVVIQAIYLLFNEGYSPSEKDKLIRKELCFEAIRLAEILKNNPKVRNKDNCHALLSLMYLNASRFDARWNESNEAVEMKNQNRNQWNKPLINKGIFFLNKGMESGIVSIYHILATISANHCIAPDFEKTNWEEILSLYDSLLDLVDSPLIRLNRSVALSKVKGSSFAINELEQLKSKTDIEEHYLFHSTIAEFHLEELDLREAAKHLNKAIFLANNERDIKLFKKKLAGIVPI